MQMHGSRAASALMGGVAALFALASAAGAESAFDAPMVANGVVVSLIQQDESDCTNTTVQDDPNRTRGGEIWVTAAGGTTTVQVAMTVTPNTTYDFYLKCVQALGRIVTDDEGIGMATFTFPSSLTGSTFAFDMYPGGAPSGNKFQSMTVVLP
ncbi:MAG: hypothetical protein HY834_02110 [Devosia nanyangense]|uniref:Spore coat protein U domain-containing protein n=1 Tax=Devosia nanyangense TaxID=1228055 RepID=A0A933L0V5_9HYPH|nr:hypothetical protein [Devosia nanyangense]